MKKLITLAIPAILASSIATAAYADQPNFVTISDIHFNPFTACANEAPAMGTAHTCTVIEDMQNQSDAQWSSILLNTRVNGSNPEPFSTYGQDPNYRLTISSLTELKDVANTHQSDFILYLGDFLGHHYDGDKTEPYKHKGFYYYANLNDDSYQSFALKSMHYIVSNVDQAAGETPVHFLLGNNDSDNGDNVFPSKAYLQAVATDFNLSTLQTKTFLAGGYYAQSINSHGEILMLNSNIFSPAATTSAGASPTAIAQGEMAWLKEQLNEAKAKHLSVWIAMHVPPGIDTFSTDTSGSGTKNTPITEWLPSYASQFTSIVTNPNYTGIIKGIFAAHMHKDGFRMLKDTSGAYDNYVSINPAISPNYGNNAAFKLYYYEPMSFNPLNYLVYYADVSNPNISQLNWKLEYNFNSAYNRSVNSDLFESYKAIAESSSLKSGTFANTYQKYYAAQYAGFNGRWLPYYYCAIRNLTSEDYIACEHSNQPSK